MRFSYNFGRGLCSYPPSSLESCTLQSRLVFQYQACANVIGSEMKGKNIVFFRCWQKGPKGIYGFGIWNIGDYLFLSWPKIGSFSFDIFHVIKLLQNWCFTAVIYQVRPRGFYSSQFSNSLCSTYHKLKLKWAWLFRWLWLTTWWIALLSWVEWHSFYNIYLFQ